MSGLLRTGARRGELVGAGAVVLATTVMLVNYRFEEDWGIGVHLAYSALAAAIVIALTGLADHRADGPPPRWHSALFVASFVLALCTLVNLADLIGAGESSGGTGTVAWIGALLLALMAWFSIRFDSGISTLIAAVTFVIVLVSFVDWAFSPDDAATFRWVLLGGALALAAFAARAPDRGAHHRVGYVNAAGVAVLSIAVVFGVDAFDALFFGGGGRVDAAVGWELVILAGGAALMAYSVWARQSGPAYLGFLNLAAFVLLAGPAGDDGPSLIGWPIVMALISVALLVAALRPSGAPKWSD